MSTDTTTERYQGEVESTHTTSSGNQVINYALNEELVKQKLADIVAELEVPEGMEAGSGGALRATITWHTRDGVEPTQDDIDLYGLMAKMILGSAAEAMGELMAEHVDPKHSAPAVDLAWGVGVYLRKK